MPEFQLLPAASPSRSIVASAQRLINLYPEADGTGQVTLYGTPGLELLVELPTKPVRAMHVANGAIYVVSGDTIYTLSPTGGYAAIGTVSTSSGPVGMADNGIQVMVMDGGTAKIITIAGSTVSSITDPDMPRAMSPVFMDGFFLFREVDSGRIWKSGAYDGTSIDGLDFATAEARPDNVVGLIADHGEVWVAGELSIEVYQNTGSSDFPFDRIPGAVIETGCASGETMLRVDNTVFWVGRDNKGGGVVWRANGYTPQRVSTHEVELILSSVDLSNTSAWSYQEDGHLFYVLNIPDAGRTMVYDVATSAWHERAYRDPFTGVNGRHRASCHCYVPNVHLVGDYETGKIYRMSLDYYDDAGDAIKRQLVSPHVRADGGRLFYSELQLRFNTGVGLISGQGEDPQACLETSNDGGNTWTPERWATIGRIGEYQARVRWTALGSGFSKTFRLTVTDPIPVAITGGRVVFS